MTLHWFHTWWHHPIPLWSLFRYRECRKCGKIQRSYRNGVVGKFGKWEDK